MTDIQRRPLVVRNGFLPQIDTITGIGPVDIKKFLAIEDGYR